MGIKALIFAVQNGNHNSRIIRKTMDTLNIWIKKYYLMTCISSTYFDGKLEKQIIGRIMFEI